MFNENILKNIKNRQVTIGYTDSDWDYDMYDFMAYMSSHPSEFKIWGPESRLLVLSKMEIRKSTPTFVKDIMRKLRKTFPRNYISCHGYCGFTNYSKSFEIHKDLVDVLYLQVIGDTEWSVWESDSDEREITPDQAKCIATEHFMPGKWIWVPRGTYHLVKPLGPRLGFSFGIGNDPEPASYLDV